MPGKPEQGMVPEIIRKHQYNIIAVRNPHVHPGTTMKTLPRIVNFI